MGNIMKHRGEASILYNFFTEETTNSKYAYRLFIKHIIYPVSLLKQTQMLFVYFEAHFEY